MYVHTDTYTHIHIRGIAHHGYLFIKLATIVTAEPCTCPALRQSPGTGFQEAAGLATASPAWQTAPATSATASSSRGLEAASCRSAQDLKVLAASMGITRFLD